MRVSLLNDESTKAYLFHETEEGRTEKLDPSGKARHPEREKILTSTRGGRGRRESNFRQRREGNGGGEKVRPKNVNPIGGSVRFFKWSNKDCWGRYALKRTEKKGRKKRKGGAFLFKRIPKIGGEE